MGKYPFGEYASRYMDSVRGVYAEETWKTRARRYRRMERRIIELKEQKRISTMSPKSMTEGDVREYLLYCKEILAPSDMVHEVNALRNLLLFAGNNAVDVCMNHNPGLRPRNKPSRKQSIRIFVSFGSALVTSRCGISTIFAGIEVAARRNAFSSRF